MYNLTFSNKKAMPGTHIYAWRKISDFGLRVSYTSEAVAHEWAIQPGEPEKGSWVPIPNKTVPPLPVDQ